MAGINSFSASNNIPQHLQDVTWTKRNGNLQNISKQVTLLITSFGLLVDLFNVMSVLSKQPVYACVYICFVINNHGNLQLCVSKTWYWPEYIFLSINPLNVNDVGIYAIGLCGNQVAKYIRIISVVIKRPSRFTVKMAWSLDYHRNDRYMCPWYSKG